jgi:putative methyltransferase (TIGR04325 family)
MKNTFLNYSDALSGCPGKGYSNPDLVKVVVEKNIIFRDRLLISSPPTLDLNSARTLLGISLAISDGKLTVLDFGGGGGYHYFIARAALPKDVLLDWRVVETPAMVTLAHDRLSNNELHFFDSIQHATQDNKDFDLLFSSGSLQYCPDPKWTLTEMLGVGAKHLFITRTPFSEEEAYIAIQQSRLKDNGPGPFPPGFDDCEISYPITFILKRETEEILKSKYTIRFSINEEGGYFSVDNKVVDSQFGYFCDLGS